MLAKMFHRSFQAAGPGLYCAEVIVKANPPCSGTLGTDKKAFCGLTEYQRKGSGAMGGGY